MTTRLRRRFTRPVISHDDSGSMILALFAIMVLTSLVSVVLMVTISQQVKTRKVTDFTFAGQAADTAVNDALFMANDNQFTDNTDTTDDPGAIGTYDKDRPRQGDAGDFMWSWYSYQDSDEPTPTWVIVATGCRNQNKGTALGRACTPNSSRSVTATLTGIVVEAADNNVGEMAYSLNHNRNFGRALFGDGGVVLLQGGSASPSIDSYNSDTGAVNTGFGQIGSNEGVRMDPNVHVDAIYFSNTQTQSSDDRCDGVQCTPSKVRSIRPKLSITDTSFIATKVNELCPPESPPVAWVASKALTPGQLELPPNGYLCYSSMRFDRDTTVVGTAESPTVVYVTGPVTVNSGVQVNAANTPTPLAGRLQIFSSGPSVTLSPDTDVAWALWAPTATCSANSGRVHVYGAMVCQSISAQGDFTASWDESLRTLAADKAGSATVWDVGAYREGAEAEIDPFAEPTPTPTH